MTTRASVAGHAPGVAVAPVNPEALKYQRMWAQEEYRKLAPGEHFVNEFLRQARPDAGSEVIDFGCGTGRGALALALFGGLKVTMVDFAGNCLDEDIRAALTTQAHALTFVKADLEQRLPVVAQYGYCTDVMEHIPPDKVDVVLDNILRAAQHVFFSISTAEDGCGELIGEPLHLTVQPYEWWLSKFNGREAVVHWSHHVGDWAFFYVTAWATGQDIVNTGVLNADEEQIRANVRHNITQGWEQVHPYPTNDSEIVVLGGGPSMPAFEADIRQHLKNGAKLITLNGAYNWAIERGLTPLNQCIVDARPFNARFTKPVLTDGSRYFIASQCDPSVLEGLPKERTLLFHTMPNLVGAILDEHYGKGGWHSIPGGSTVLLRTIPLMRMLGFRFFHLYGCDSCLLGDAHHAYAQPENDGGMVLPVTLNASGRVFYCHPWMVSQAQEFVDLIRKIGDTINLAVYGDGLLAHILETGASVVTTTADEEGD